MRSFMRGRRPQSRPLEILCEDHIGKYVIPFLFFSMAYGGGEN